MTIEISGMASRADLLTQPVLTPQILHRAIANALRALGHGDAYVVTGLRLDRTEVDYDITIKLGGGK